MGWVSIFDNGTVQRILDIPKRVVPVAYLCVGKVKGYHPRPELETAGWLPRLPLESLVHFDHWGEQGGEPELLARLGDDARMARRGRLVP